MAIPTIVGIGEYAFGTGPITPSLPDGIAAGMMLVMPVETASGEAATASGWTAAPDSPVNNSNGTRLTILYRRATGSGDAPLVVDSGDHQSARIIGFNGVVAAGDPWDVTNSSTGDTTVISIAGDTTTGSDELVVILASHSIDKLSEHFSGWANTDLTSVTEQFDNSTDAGNGGGIACITGGKAAAGMFGATTATGAEDAAWSGWVGALKPGTPVEPPSEESSEESSGESEEDPEVPNTDTFGIDTWQFDTPEDSPADRDSIPYFLAWQMMDNSSENRDKRISAIRITAKGKDIEVQVHAASPESQISRENIENGVGARSTVEFPDSSQVTRYAQELVRIKNLSIWTVRYSGTDDGQGDVRDRLDELIIVGDTHGTER